MTETAYPNLDLVENLFKDTVWDAAVKSGLTGLFSAAPYLGVWPLRSIITALANKVSERLYAALKMTVDLHAITFTNESHRREFDTAAVKLKIIARNFGVESEQFKQARKEAQDALAKFASFGGH